MTARKEQSPLISALVMVLMLLVACSRPSVSTSATPTVVSPTKFSASINPASRASSAQNLRFERISIAQGLSHSTVKCILQDSKGFMWLGTEDGLNKYDGHDFTVYKHNPDDPHSLSHNWIKSLYLDRSGTLWAGTVDRLGDDWHLGVRYDQGIDYVNQRGTIKRT